MDGHDGQRTRGDTARARRLLMLSVAVLLVAGSVLGSLFYLQRRATSQNIRELETHARQEAQEKREATALAKAKWLREQWRPWAEKHKDILQRMLKAKPGDKAALMAVWDAIPMIPSRETTGIGLKDLFPDIRADTRLAGKVFGWGAISKNLSNPSPEMEASFRERAAKDPQSGGDLAAHRERHEKGLNKNFAALRDIVIAGSAMPGPTQFKLWASGRITTRTFNAEQSEIVERDGKKFRETWRDWGSHEEIMPPYDFLQEERRTQ